MIIGMIVIRRRGVRIVVGFVCGLVRLGSEGRWEVGRGRETERGYVEVGKILAFLLWDCDCDCGAEVM